MFVNKCVVCSKALWESAGQGDNTCKLQEASMLANQWCKLNCRLWAACARVVVVLGMESQEYGQEILNN